MAHGLASEGTRRLRLLLGWTAVVACLGLYVVVILTHGAPYWSGWWVVMAGLLVLAFPLGRLVAGPLEWVFAGYRLR